MWLCGHKNQKKRVFQKAKVQVVVHAQWLQGAWVDLPAECVLAMLCKRQALVAFRPPRVGGFRLSTDV